MRQGGWGVAGKARQVRGKRCGGDVRLGRSDDEGDSRGPGTAAVLTAGLTARGFDGGGPSRPPDLTGAQRLLMFLTVR